MIPKPMTHIEVLPGRGDVEFHIDIDGKAAIRAHADHPQCEDVIDTLESARDGSVDDDEGLVIDEA